MGNNNVLKKYAALQNCSLIEFICEVTNVSITNFMVFDIRRIFDGKQLASFFHYYLRSTNLKTGTHTHWYKFIAISALSKTFSTLLEIIFSETF